MAPIKKKNSYLIFILLFSGLAFIYYNLYFKATSKPDLADINAASNYRLIGIEINNNNKFVASVQIQSKMAENELLSIANRVKEDILAKSDKGNVFFLLPEMIPNNGAWAAVDFTPTASVRIIGQSLAEERIISENLNNITDYIGLWSDNGRKGDVVIRIRKDHDLGFVIEPVSPVNPQKSKLATPLTKKTINGKTYFIDKENNDQFYILEENGDLSAHDNYGIIDRYIKLK